MALRSAAASRFWKRLEILPASVRRLARKNFDLWKRQPRHPSLRFKQVKPGLWSVRVGADHRALAAFDGTTFLWFWIGPHDEYKRIIASH